jgi:hypothetical protein
MSRITQSLTQHAWQDLATFTAEHALWLKPVVRWCVFYCWCVGTNSTLTAILKAASAGLLSVLSNAMDPAAPQQPWLGITVVVRRPVQVCSVMLLHSHCASFHSLAVPLQVRVPLGPRHQGHGSASADATAIRQRLDSLAALCMYTCAGTCSTGA